jgi:hypothetical protein
MHTSVSGMNGEETSVPSTFYISQKSILIKAILILILLLLLLEHKIQTGIYVVQGEKLFPTRGTHRTMW